MPFIKLNQPKYLADRSYLIADTDPDSTYFDVSEVPDILTGGKNLFMLKGNKSLLAPGSIIEIEVTDLNGRVIYHENANYLEPGTKRRAVAIYVYEHTPQGGGVITITGTAQKRPNGKSVSLELQKTPNVKWQKKINVLPQNENITRVILNRTPVVQIKEVVREYLTPTGGISSGVVTNASSDSFFSFTNEGNFFTSPDTSYGYLHTTGSYFLGTMVDGQVHIWNITDELMNFHSDGDAFTTNTQTNGYSSLLFTISEVINDKKVKVTPAWQTSVTTTIADHFVPGGGFIQGYSTINAATYPIGFDEGANHFHAYQQPTTWVSETLNSQSFAKVDIAELDPICGDIKRLAVYKRSQGVQQWHFVTDVILENKEQLARDDAQGLNQNLGDFSTQTVLNTYWTGSFGGFDGTDPGLTPYILSDPSIFINGAVISGSEELVAATTTGSRENAYAEFRMLPSADWNGDGASTSGVALKANTSYILSMKLAGQAVSDGVSIPTIKIFASGSAIDLPSEDSTMRKFATLQANSEFVAGKSAGIGILDESTLNYNFETSTAGDMGVVFRIVSGRWWISDVSIKPASQTGFTPNHTSVEFPMEQIAQQNDVVDFKFELYDNIGNLVHTEATQSLLWSGGNVAINGDNNVIEGSLIVGSGIVFEGVSTG
tara:strand:+ start:1873 stop:3852 length:1980 start_codon:yes stop_codon:yes gene_type:complete